MLQTWQQSLVVLPLALSLLLYYRLQAQLQQTTSQKKVSNSLKGKFAILLMVLHLRRKSEERKPEAVGEEQGLRISLQLLYSKCSQIVYLLKPLAMSFLRPNKRVYGLILPLVAMAVIAVAQDVASHKHGVWLSKI
jgi:hypothetical protein